MSTDILETSAAFFKATASYFGIPADQMMLGTQRATVDGVFRVTLDIALMPADLIGITRRMDQLRADIPDQKQQSVRALIDMAKTVAAMEDTDDILKDIHDKLGECIALQAEQRQSQEQDSGQDEQPHAVTYEDVARNPQAFKDAGQALDKLKQLEDAGVAYGNLSAAEKSQYGSRRNFVLHIARTMDDIEALSTSREVKHIDTEQEPDDTVEFVWLTAGQVTDAQKQFASEVDATGKYAINVQMLTAEQRTALGMDEGGLPG